MNYFRCTVGGSGKGNTVTVTCAEEFAGLTITLAKTGKTYTKTCPSTAPYTVTYYGVENGTYTVSCTVDGETYSETVIVQDISCVLNYGFNWKIWVDTASQLDSSDYDSLDEVLEDEKALRELFLEHACVDYMASVAASNGDLETVINDDYCAKWINNCDYALDFLGANTVIKALMDEADKYGYGEWVITDSTTTPPTWGPKGNVPVMTANNAPYGTVSASTQYNNDYGAWRAFDGGETSAENYWSSTSGSVSNQWISYKFVNPTNVKRLFILANILNNDNKMPKDCKLQYSNDGTNWVDVATFTNPQTTVRNYQDTPNNIYALYWRVLFINNYGDSQYMYVREIQFYGRELKVSVPKMTSNSAPFGEAIKSAQLTNYEAYKAFDGSDSTYWCDSDGSKTNIYIGYSFTKSINIKKVRFLLNGSLTSAMTVKIQGSNTGDAGDWHDVSDEYSYDSSWATTGFDEALDSNTSYTKYRVFILSHTVSGSSGNGRIASLQFYGLDYSEKEFEVGTTKKWLYDHGVELVSIENHVGNTGITPVRNESSIICQSGSASGGSYSDVYAILDVSDYNLLRARVGDYFIASKTVIGLYGLAFSSDLATYTIPSANCPNSIGLNISNVNQECDVAFSAVSGGNGKVELKEFWLE